MAPLPEVESAQPPELGFSVSHQRVHLDIDLVSRSLRGRTELTINPHSKDLKTIRLNCRQCRLHSVTINGKSTSGVTYEDVYERAELHWEANVHQYHMLQERLEHSLKDVPQEELLITIPKTVKLEELDPFSDEAQMLLPSKALPSNKRESDANTVELLQATRTGVDQTARFTPLTLNIEYEISRIRDGIHFVGFEEGDLRYPHAYTLNSSYSAGACCLYPCLDHLSSRCTWEISVNCARTIGDALRDIRWPSSKTNDAAYGSNGSKGSFLSEASKSFSDEDKALELSIICSGDLTDEIVDFQDSSRKTTSFIVSKEVAARHIGISIGPFEQIDLALFRESDEDERLGQNAVPLLGYCLPGRVEDLKNTCFPLAKAVDFFTIAYGSYPYSNYRVCFIDDALADVLHTATLSICSSRLLFPEDTLEPIERVTRQLVHALASQWMGIDIVAKEPVDTWVVIGIAYYITDTFMRKLCGRNDYRYNQKRATDRVVELDLDRPSLAEMGPLVGLDSSELEFMILKAPLVLFMLDNRMIKGGATTGLPRIISRIFLNAKVGDLPDGTLDTPYFIKQCERMGHTKLEQFFAQWIDGAGCPKFRVTQRFNKKKLVVEMTIQQVQTENPKEKDLESETFMRDVKEEQHEVYAGGTQPCFTGPMTIRIHEADGTPYEHIVEIKESLQRVEIPYNTKYKRLKRNRRQKERHAPSGGNEYAGDDTGDVLLYSLGDVLQSEDDVKKWKLAEWSQDDEERMSQESYEWIRMDADFEWICKFSLTMPGYMWVSQLQQDRDVVAQLESIHYLEVQKGHPLISTFLVRTLMDQRYFHGIRTSAAAALTKNARDDIGWIGLLHLEKAFQELFCYPNGSITRPNDFSDRVAYMVQCAIPQAIANVRDASGRALFRVRSWLFEKLRYNDNSNNEFSDSHYVSILMKALAHAMSSTPISSLNEVDDFEDGLPADDIQFHNGCLEELDRYRRIDEWIPSHLNVVSISALECKLMLAKAGVIKVDANDFLQYTSDGTSDYLRLSAFASLMDLGFATNHAVLQWFLFILGIDPSPFMREQMLRIFGRTLGAIAIGEASEASAMMQPADGLIVEIEASTESRKADLLRKQTVTGALQALKQELESNPTLQKGLWSAITSPKISLQQMWQLLEICDRLYVPQTSMIVALKLPRYWKCTKTGKGKVVFSRTERIRTKPLPKRSIKLKINAAAAAATAATSGSSDQRPAIRRNNSSGSGGLMGAPPPPQRTLLKPPKPPPPQSLSGASSMDNGLESPIQGEGEKKKTMKLKLKFGSFGGTGGAGSPPI